MGRVIHFDMTADDPERVQAFFESVFGWSFHKWDGPMDYWLVTTGPDGEPGINGGLSRRGEQSGPLTNTIQVADLDAAVEAVRRSGGTVTMEKSPIPGVGWFAGITDPEGNAFGMMQPDDDAGE